MTQKKIILVHGIGDATPGWTKAINAAELLEVSPERIEEFVYEDILEKNWFHQMTVTAAKLYLQYQFGSLAANLANQGQDYIDDVLAYFFVPGVRNKILDRLAQVLNRYPNALLVGYSLGSVICYEGLKNRLTSDHKVTFISLGSPLSKRVVRQFLKVPDKSRPQVSNWFNFYGTLDPVSGGIKHLGCYPEDQFKITAGHQFSRYLLAVKNFLKVFGQSEKR
ncbi:MAG: hypothetical protein KTR14_08040 [Vampirovibrio sp.]|nr:hypothetical protein [Vampirovibrio sp.]